MQGGTKREVVSWKLSAALFWWFLVILNVFACNMLLQNACKHHQKDVRKTDEHGPKMVPKPLQNRSWRGSGGHLGATLETRCFQDLIFDDFCSNLGPLWDQFGLILGIMFLMFFWNGFLMALASIWPPKIPPKWEPKGCQRHISSKSENRALAAARARSRGVWGCWKSSFFRCFFGTLFRERFGNPLWRFWFTFGVPFGDHFGHFLGTIFASIFWPPKNIEKWRGCWERAGAIVHTLPPPRTPPP